MKEIICQDCKKRIETPDCGDGTFDYSEVFEYRGFNFHGECLLDEGTNKEAKAENNKAKEFIDSIINLFKGK